MPFFLVGYVSLTDMWDTRACGFFFLLFLLPLLTLITINQPQSKRKRETLLIILFLSYTEIKQIKLSKSAHLTCQKGQCPFLSVSFKSCNYSCSTDPDTSYLLLDGGWHVGSSSIWCQIDVNIIFFLPFLGRCILGAKSRRREAGKGPSVFWERGICQQFPTLQNIFLLFLGGGGGLQKITFVSVPFSNLLKSIRDHLNYRHPPRENNSATAFF